MPLKKLFFLIDGFDNLGNRFQAHHSFFEESRDDDGNFDIGIRK